ncbi:MAG: L-threonylcarbamoyladenylate synthase [Kiritimatiellaeota bacterium]|nr:L-threonylcarbamoyladenylate synthase [Kiritimatiellota bacterium]
MQKLRPVDVRQPDAAAIAEALTALRCGELVIVPTETVYGLAADDRNPAALGKLFEAKGRPQDKPIALLAAGVVELERHGAKLPPAARRLADKFWPGPLTLVLDSPVGWLGFRIPDHPVMLALLRAWGGVLAVTSANRSGEPPATTAAAALAALESFVALALDSGPAAGGVPSTVVKVNGEHVEILRTGAIADAEIRNVVQA